MMFPTETNLQEVFISHLDSLYFEGYAEQLASENPEAYDFEFKKFLAAHSGTFSISRSAAYAVCIYDAGA